jgi:N-formylglutamate deformylase
MIEAKPIRGQTQSIRGRIERADKANRQARGCQLGGASQYRTKTLYEHNHLFRIRFKHAVRPTPISGTVEERQAICLDDEHLNSELLRMTDAYTDELFPPTPVEADRVIFPISRLVCDVERFPSDENEPMSRRGMGAIYTRTSLGEVLRANPKASERHSILDRWYRPHHSMLERIVNGVVAKSGRCLIIDCHSFPSIALPYELDQTDYRADICIGTDPFHTPSMVRDATIAAAENVGYSVTIDTPFAGALVPLASYRNDPRILSLMIEVNREIYMDEQSGLKKQDFERTSTLIGKLIAAAADCV